jgi:hypothetical protein
MLCDAIYIGSYSRCDVVTLPDVDAPITLNQIATRRECEYDPDAPTKLATGDYIYEWNSEVYSFYVL